MPTMNTSWPTLAMPCCGLRLPSSLYTLPGLTLPGCTPCPRLPGTSPGQGVPQAPTLTGAPLGGKVQHPYIQLPRCLPRGAGSLLGEDEDPTPHLPTASTSCSDCPEQTTGVPRKNSATSQNALEYRDISRLVPTALQLQPQPLHPATSRGCQGYPTKTPEGG